MGLDAVPDEMGWREAIGHVRILRSDPSSQFAAALEGWAQPYAHGDLIAMRQYELTQAAAGAKKPQPYPTAPWASDVRETRRKGNAAGRTPEQVKELLRTGFGQVATS